MKRMLALLLAAMLILTLLPGCGKKDPGGDAPKVPENPTEQGGETPDVTPEPEPYVDPYDAVRTYWSEDRLTQSWGPDQIVEHLFFHPVIAYPQWAFHDCGASQSERYGLDDWMVTADEYAKILQSVYEKGYILVAIEDVWSEVTDESGTHMVRNTLKLPEGKKPLIISFDDVNYYPYMLEQGFTSKLVVGEDGEIWAECTDPYTKETFLTKEGDATTMLDEFVYEHPDFSLNGAKAIFSLTGYYGILGYRTQDDRDIAKDSPERAAFEANRAAEIEAVKPVIARLKETGWATSVWRTSRCRPSSTTPSAGRTRSAAWSAPPTCSSIRTAGVPTATTGTRPASASNTCKVRASASSRASASIRSATSSRTSPPSSATVCIRTARRCATPAAAICNSTMPRTSSIFRSVPTSAWTGKEERMSEHELMQKAIEMLDRAYIPYSHFPVGAALECEDGAVYTGCNIENSSYSLTLCAERTAAVKAVSEGHTKFRRIVIVGNSEDFCYPCGACRQFLYEFSPDMEVICLNRAREAKRMTLRELMPCGFDSTFL